MHWQTECQMKLNKQWQNIFQFETYVQHDNNKVHERFNDWDLHAQLIKFKNIFLKDDDWFIIITTSDFYETHVRKSTKIKKKNKVIYIFEDGQSWTKMIIYYQRNIL